MDLPVLTGEHRVDPAEVSSSASGLSSGALSAAALVERLGPLLTHAEAAKRKTGLEFLSAALDAVRPADVIGAEELDFLAAFYVDRLKGRNEWPAEIRSKVSSKPNIRSIR